MRLSRIMRHVAAFSLAVGFVAPALLCAPVLRAADHASGALAPSKTTGPTDSPADDLVRQALKAEIDGDSQRRAAYLADALAADPDNASAHWHSGEVRSGDRWVTIADCAATRARDDRIVQYRQKREHAGNTAAAEIGIARWCESKGLTDEERVHLVLALQAGPTKRQPHEIIRKLGLVNYFGTWMPAQQAEILTAQSKRTEQDFHDWKPFLAELRRKIEGHDSDKRMKATAELRAIRDIGAIPALEWVFANSRPETVAIVIAALADMPEQEATDSLIRHAIRAQSEDVRRIAATALKDRPIFAYIPTLISVIKAPVEVQVSTTANGSPGGRLVARQEGAVTDQVFDSAMGVDIKYYSRLHHKFWSYGNHETGLTPKEQMRIVNDVAIENAKIEWNNDRVMEVLRTATGKELKPIAREWWDWWLSYNEIYQPEYRAVQYGNTLVRYMSCFPAGTPVETSTGTLPIEQVHPGDCVLAQDPDSGELAYKPVMAVTLRPPSPVIEIRTEQDTIRATRGHPFWVSGIGWQMAKELKAGQWLHTVAGPVRIESADERGEAECHNLVVADFNSYFVGRDRVLVHDNNLRQVTTATVPGLVNP